MDIYDQLINDILSCKHERKQPMFCQGCGAPAESHECSYCKRLSDLIEYLDEGSA
jgi:hypothetical protein